MKILDIAGCLVFKQLVWLPNKTGGPDAVCMKNKHKAKLKF